MKPYTQLDRLMDEITLRAIEVGGSKLGQSAKQDFAPALNIESDRPDMALKQAEIGALRLMAVCHDGMINEGCNKIIEMAKAVRK